MKDGRILRWIAIGMLLVAIAFLAFALTHPEAGRVFYVFGLRIGTGVWQVFYIAYAAVTLLLFVASFLLGRRK